MRKESIHFLVSGKRKPLFVHYIMSMYLPFFWEKSVPQLRVIDPDRREFVPWLNSCIIEKWNSQRAFVTHLIMIYHYRYLLFFIRMMEPIITYKSPCYTYITYTCPMYNSSPHENCQLFWYHVLPYLYKKTQ